MIMDHLDCLVDLTKPIAGIKHLVSITDLEIFQIVLLQTSINVAHLPFVINFYLSCEIMPVDVCREIPDTAVVYVCLILAPGGPYGFSYHSWIRTS